MNEIETVTDYVTGKELPLIGPEGNRQLFEKVLVEEKGYKPEEITVDRPIDLTVNGEPYGSVVDIIVTVENKAVMAARCIAGSLASYEREVLAAARLVFDYRIPFSVSTDGESALVRDTATGKPYGEGMDNVPSRRQALEMMDTLDFTPIPEEKKEREKIIFRSYDMVRYEDECRG
ncbi:MAG: type I restriction enzyme HsdR N-terminal domain-containing protein [Desulfobacteraceae bacterium]